MGGHLQDGVDRLLLGRIDERAGIHHDDVGIFGAGGDLRAVVRQQAHHDFGVDQVFGASEGDKAHLFRGIGFVVRGATGDFVSSMESSYFSIFGGHLAAGIVRLEPLKELGQASGAAAEWPKRASS